MCSNIGGNWGNGAKRRFRQAGFGDKMDKISKMGTAAERDSAAQSLLNEGAALQLANASPLAGVSVGGKLRSTLLEEYGIGGVGGAAGFDRAAELRKVLERESNGGSGEAKKLLERFDSIKDPVDKMRFVKGVEEAGGITKGTSMEAQAEKLGPLAGALAGSRTGMTVKDQDRAMGMLMTGRQEAAKGGLWGHIGAGAASGAVVGAVGGATVLGGGAVVGGILGGLIGGAVGAAEYYLGGAAREERMGEAAGAFARSKEGMSLVGDIMSGDQVAQEEARVKAQEMIQQGRGTDDENLRMRAEIGSNILAIDEIQKLPPNASDEQIQPILDKWKAADPEKRKNATKEDMFAQAGGTAAGHMKVANANMQELKRIVKRAGIAEEKRVTALGVMTYDETKGEFSLSATAREDLQKMSASGRAAGEKAAALTGEIISAEKAGDPDRARELTLQKSNILSGMSIEDLGQYRKSTMDPEAAVMESGAKRFRSMSRKGGAGTAIGAYFGAGETREQKRALQQAWAKGEKGEDEFLKEIVSQGGFTGDAATSMMGKDSELRKAVQAARKGGKGSEAAVAGALERMQSDPAMSAALKEQQYQKSGPQDKMVANLEKLAANMNPEKMASALKSAMEGAKFVVQEAGKTNAEGGA